MYQPRLVVKLKLSKGAQAIRFVRIENSRTNPPDSHALKASAAIVNNSRLEARQLCSYFTRIKKFVILIIV